MKSSHGPAMSTPPVPAERAPQRIASPSPPRIASPRPGPKHKRGKKPNAANVNDPVPTGLLDGSVPPINVLIVEDNIINLKLLEAFLKRLKVRWSTAMNGQIAVNKWREGGFHLVLMDIQLPVMNGLDATKEIRRLERVNNIGVFTSNSASSSTPTIVEETGSVPNGNAEGDGDEDEPNAEPKEEDNLMNTAMFKSPVIIVALTASSLQSDRHEALAAGCNDFLTKVRLLYTQCSLHQDILADLHQLCLACQFRLALPESNGMGLHASSYRLRRLAQMERFLLN